MVNARLTGIDKNDDAFKGYVLLGIYYILFYDYKPSQIKINIINGKPEQFKDKILKFQKFVMGVFECVFK